MSIRIKLVILILILVAAFGAATVTYFVGRAPLAAIRTEEQTLTTLRGALEEESLASSDLIWKSFPDALASLETAQKRTLQDFKKVDQLSVLPGLSPSIKDAIGNIKTLRALLESNTSSFLSTARKLLHDSKELPGVSSEFTLIDLDSSNLVSGTDAGESVVAGISSVLTQLYILSSRFSMSMQMIDGQYATISKEVTRIEARSALSALFVILGLILFSVLIALLLSNRIVLSVRTIVGDIGRMRTGDLTATFESRTRDEIGTLSDDMNAFIISLRDSIRTVQSASGENLQMKASLTAVTEQTSVSTSQIQTSVEQIDRRLVGLTRDLDATTTAAGEITSAIGELSREIGDQASMVEESTSAVTEMISSIDNVARIAERRSEAMRELSTAVTDGGEKVASSFAHITQISESLESVGGIATIIKSISAQTNLLAMNAAIEAAHAGDAGRGFSVVADEIRALAEASAANSQEISRILSQVVHSVEVASSSGSLMSESYRRIDTEVRGIMNTLAEIFGSMEELRSGGGQILEAMESLRVVSTNIRDGSSAIRQRSSSIRDAAEAGQRTGEEVRAGMADIVNGIGEISSALSDVVATARRLGDVGESLNQEITRFRV